GPQQLQRVRVEGDNHGGTANQLRLPAQLGGEGAVATVDPVEVADGKGAAATVGRGEIVPVGFMDAHVPSPCRRADLPLRLWILPRLRRPHSALAPFPHRLIRLQCLEILPLSRYSEGADPPLPRTDPCAASCLS